MADRLLDRYLAPPSASGEGDPLVDQIRAEVRRGAVLEVQRSSAPDRAAEAARLARAEGMSPSTVDRNLDVFKDRERARAWSKALEVQPEMAGWVARNAAVSSDDVDALAGISKRFREAWSKPEPKPYRWSEVPGNVVGALRSGTVSLARGVTDAARAYADLQERYDPTVSLQRRLLGGTMYDPVQRGLGQYSAFQGRTADATRPDYTRMGRIERGLTQGVESIPGSVAALGATMLGAPQVGLGLLGVSTAGTSYREGREAGLTETQAAAYGASQGSVEVLTESLPVLRYLQDAKVGSSLFKRVGANMLAEQTSEQAATAWQDLNTWAAIGRNKGKTFGDYLAERPDAAIDTALAVTSAVGGTNLSIEGTRAVVERLADSRAAAAAKREGAFLADAGEDAAKSRTRERDPDAFAELIRVVGNDATERVYVSGEAVASYLQSDPEADREFWQAYEGNIAEAVASGGDVILPTADVLAHLAGTAAWDALRDDMRLSAGGMSMREAAAFDEEGDAAFERLGEEVETAGRREAAPRQRVFERIYSQLLNAGYTPDAARTQAEITTAYAATRAARRGAELTGTEYDALEVQQVLPEKLAPLVAGDQLDVVIQSMRRARTGKAPNLPSLLDFLSKRGGVEDPGGDLASMGADRWHLREKAVLTTDKKGRERRSTSIPFRRQLIRPSADARQDTMLAAGTVSENTLEASFQAAIDEGYFPELVGREGEGSTYTDKVDVAAFMDAISAELRGTPRYAETLETDATRDAALELEQLLDEAGLDPATATNGQIREAIERYRQVAEGGARLYQSLYHGTPFQWEEFDPDEATYDGWWFSTSSSTAKSFGLDRAGEPPHNPGNRKINVIEAELDDAKVMVVEPMEEARRLAAEIGGEVPAQIDDWQSASEVLQWADAQRHWLDDAREQGYDAVWFKDVGDDPGGVVSDHIAVLNFSKARVISRTLQQTYGKDARGQVSFEQNRTIIQLFEKRDLSTFMHEVGHTWLEDLRADAADPDATEAVRRDWEAVTAWFAELGHPVGEVIPVEAHEFWARGVERYLMEGKAPSPGLRSAFEALRSWLLTIYRAVQNLNSPITPEIRDVMNRMLATEEEIEAAREEQRIRGLFDDTAAVGMSEAEAAGYQASLETARTEAFDALLYKTMAAVRAKARGEYKEQRETVWGEVATSVAERPVWRAMAMLSGRQREARLDRDWLVREYGADVLDLIPKAVPAIYTEGGVDPDVVAEMVGFATGRDMVDMLMGVEQRRVALRSLNDKRSLIDSVIDEETDAIMADRFGDILADGTIEREARELIHNDQQGEVIAFELRVLARQRRRSSDPNQAPTPYAIAKRWAAEKVATGAIRDVASRSAIEGYRRAARNAAREAEKTMLAGDIDETFRQKQRQMLNNALVAEASRTADEIEAAVARMGKVAKRRTSKTIDQDYLEQAQSLLEQVDLKARSQVSIDRQGAFEAWARGREAEGVDVVVPASFEATLGQTHWTRLTVETLLGLDASVAQIIHLGRLKQTLLDGAEQRAFDVVVGEAVGSAGQLRQRPPSDLMEPGFWDRLKSKVAAFDAALLKMEAVFLWLDRGDTNGVFTRIAFRPIAAAQDRENTMLADYAGRVRNAFSAVPEAVVKRWPDRVEVGLINRETGRPWIFNRAQLVAMALNTGNAGNLQRLTDGYGWSPETVRAVLDAELTAEEWRFVQSVWDIVDTLWPEISAMERRVNGVAPEKVEAVPFTTSAGGMRGGYYPAIYDSGKSYAAERYSAENANLLEGGYTKATTRASSTKDRVEKVERPILLNLGVINRHLGEVIHDITHREAVMNAWKFLGNERVMRAVDDSLGPEIRRQFKPWLQFVANSWAMERAGNEGVGKFVNGLRANATIVGMGFRFSTMMMQIAGYSNSFEAVGARWVLPGVAQVAKQPIETTRFVLDRSPEIVNRMSTLDRDIRLAAGRLDGIGGALADAKRAMFWGIGIMDRVVVVPTWLGAYNKALAGGATEGDAVYAADAAVRVSQGAGSPKDLAAIARGTGQWGQALKLMTMFYSYMSAFYQRQRTLGRDVTAAVRERDYRMTPRLLMRAWWLIVVPPLLAEMLAGRGPDDDEDWGWWSFRKMLSQSLGPIPLARDLLEPAWAKAVGKPSFGYSLSPVQRVGETFVNTAGDVGRIARGEETKRATRNTMEAAGYATGLVPGQVATATQFLVDVGYGEQDPEGVAEWWRGLTTGKVGER